MSTPTTNVGIAKPASNEANWGTTCNTNFDLLDALGAVGPLAVREHELPSTSLAVKVAAGIFRNALGAVVTYAGSSSTTLGASVTSYLYLTDAGVLTVNTTGFPAATNIVPLATVDTDATTVTAVVDSRRPWQSFGGTAPFVAKTGDTMTGLLVLSADPAAALGAATRQYVDATATGATAKPTATLATAAALPANTYANGTAGVGATLTATSNGALTVDGVAVAAGDLILVKNQASGFQNGLYSVTAAGSGGTPYVLTRHASMDQAAEFAGAQVAVRNGTANANSLWLANPSGAVTVGTTAIPFGQVTPPTTSLRIDSHYGVITADADGATITFDLDLSDKHSVTLGGNRTLAVTGGHDGQVFVLLLKQDATGSRTITAWFSGILWPGGSPPALTTLANKTDVFSFLRTGSGAYIGSVVGQNC